MHVHATFARLRSFPPALSPFLELARWLGCSRLPAALCVQFTSADPRHQSTASLALESGKLVAALRVSVDDKVDPAIAQVAHAVVQEHLN